MVTTTYIAANYTPLLNPMTEWIHTYLSKENDQEMLDRTYKGIADFCYQNSPEFHHSFISHCGLETLPNPIFSENKDDTASETAFLEHIVQMDGECVFLLRDTYSSLKKYQEKKGCGYGLLINRRFLCQNNNEDDYFLLIELLYRSLEKSVSIPELIKNYQQEFDALLAQNEHFRTVAQQISEYVTRHNSGEKIIWIDYGFQFTFVLFCQAALSHFTNNTVKQDFYCFTTYPWLQSFFKEKFFSTHNEVALQLELDCVETYSAALQNKAAGSLVGFAVGDSLGFPIAGIDVRDTPRCAPSNINGFTENKQHPFFGHLSAGQYTDNTVLLQVTAKHILKNQSFKIAEYEHDLANWANSIKNNAGIERWAGPTALRAAQRLAQGYSYLESGSTTTDSCSSTYRVIPLALFCRPFAKPCFKDFFRLAEECGMITHNSEVSRAGVVAVASILTDCINDLLPHKAVSAAVRYVATLPGTDELVNKMQLAINWSSTKSDEEARRYFGTGSPMVQTLPLSIFYFLKYQNSFAEGILAAANSYRSDTPEEQARLAGLNWQEQLLEVNGGNADGIAGLTGAFIGAHVGFSAIPQYFLAVEDSEKLQTLGHALVQ